MLNRLQIIPIPAFKDNYIWLIHNDSFAIVVDPGDASVVIPILKQLKLELLAILITHHHSDHVDGVVELAALYPDANTYAPKLEQYPFNHIPVSGSDVIELSALNLQFSVIDTPGHTLGHIAYHTEFENQSALFCGDTLFGAGCGRLFEGTPQQMQASLLKLSNLPPATQVYCTHEYTLHNINFALTLEPNNQSLIERQQATLALRNMQQPSLPSSIELEIATNPFLRCNSPEIRAAIKLENAPVLQVFTAIRELRNHY